MSLIPVTITVAPGDIRPAYMLRRVSDKVVLNPQTISNTNPPALPNPGPDQEYLPILIEEIVPDNDPVYTVRTLVQTIDEQAKQVLRNYAVTDKPKEEAKEAASNAARRFTQLIMPTNDATSNLIIITAAVTRQASGLNLTEDEQKALDYILSASDAVKHNLVVLNDKLAAIDAGQKPDLTSGYVDTAGVPEPVDLPIVPAPIPPQP